MARDHGLPPTLESVFMTYTGRSLDDDVEEEENDDDAPEPITTRRVNRNQRTPRRAAIRSSESARPSGSAPQAPEA